VEALKQAANDTNFAADPPAGFWINELQAGIKQDLAFKLG
jgi:hypothetical protein